MLMQHVWTYNSHLQAKLRTVNALQGGCAHLGSHMAYSVFAVFFLRLTNVQQHYVQITYTKFHPNRTIYVEIM